MKTMCAAELALFVRGACAEYGLSAPIALGYSNGANIAAALLTLDPTLLAGAVLLRAMAPFKDMPPIKLAHTTVLLLSGTQDQMIPLADAQRLAEKLRSGGATVSHELIATGHGLTQIDLTHITDYFNGAE